ncbi:MAG: Gx transporter family protein [Spirochaetaceae bacterium]|nr:Gx transporter family protein [Spirochaetaceae bacterium]
MVKSTDKLKLTSFLGGLCLFLSAIEYLFPRPVPFMRLGLANLPVLFALKLLPFPYVLLLILLKITGQGLISGTLASYVFLFSAAGSFTSAVVMYSVYRIPAKFISLIGVSVLGALTGNIIQLILSVKFIFGDSAWVIASLFLTIGTVSSFLIGLFAVRFMKRSQWISSLEGPL